MLQGKLLILIAGLAAFCGAQAILAEESPRTLIIALDAVPYRTVAELADPSLGDAALFRGLRGPVPVISTFPSTTSLAFAGLLEPLGLKKSPGYEAKFFDRQRGRIRGGGLISYGKIEFPWREFWDWKMRGLWAKMLSGARPVKTCYRSIRRSLAEFAESDKDVYFIYYTTTDLVSHLKSPSGLEPVLRRLDESLAELREDNPGRPFRVVIFSDHGIAGGEPLVNVRKGLKRALKQAGYHKAKRLRHDNHVVFVPFGLVSSFVAFTREGREAEVARILGRVEGVQICAAPVEGGWQVEGSGGSALIRRTEDDRWSYEPQAGDPLKLTGIADGSAHPDGWWLEATRRHEYPDPLFRIVRGFDLVENPASVICGTRPGYMFGAGSTETLSNLTVGRLRWTHGALDREPTLGFLMSDAEGWEVPPAPLRFNEALLPFID